jgi:ATP-dependent DNA helicase RecQ
MSTYGIGQEFGAVGWRDLIDQLLFEGLLREDPNDGRPLIGLGEAAEVRALYRGARRVSVRKLPTGERSDGSGRSGRLRRRRDGDGPAVDAADAALFAALRAWRRERASEQHVPPYVIFHDATLSDMARKRPKNSEDLKDVSGVGQSKLQRYGAAVLELVRKHSDSSHSG